MKIVSLNSSHDGTIVFLKDGNLVFSLESEKNSFRRHLVMRPDLVFDAMSYLEDIPDVLATGGWFKAREGEIPSKEYAGYYGVDRKNISSRESVFLGNKVKRFSSSHERSHLMCAYGMSPFEQGRPCYALVWEGSLGDFYKIDQDLNIIHLGRVLHQPGIKYSCFYWVADSLQWSNGYSVPGRLMALSSFSDYAPLNEEETKLIEFVFKDPSDIWDMSWKHFEWSSFSNIGVEDPAFKNLAGKMSNYLFNLFYEFAKNHLTEQLPLLISGGCGLNCDWNTQWKNCGLFPEVFVPPCPNDSGSAIGTAVDAQFYYTGNAKIKWDVYAGDEFIDDVEVVEGFAAHDLDYEQVADFLNRNHVIAWVQGRYEIGPRALGNRSLLAAPFTGEMRDRLNDIKKREGYRPVAPVCMEEDVSEHFEWSGPSPYMLYFQKLKTEKLKAITHVDNTARVQTVNTSQNPNLHRLLTEFKRLSGFGVLCNTSLNFPGAGFINEMGDLMRHVQERGIDGFVVNNKFYLPKNT